MKKKNKTIILIIGFIAALFFFKDSLIVKYHLRNLDVYYDSIDRNKIELEEGVLRNAYILDKDTDREKYLITGRGSYIYTDKLEGSLLGFNIGDSLDSVVKKNGKEFLIYGFEWSGAGVTADWLGGDIDNNIELRFKLENDPDNQLIGDIKINTVDINTQENLLQVERITIFLE